MALEEEDSGGGIPEWVVTFGDMMSLLLTFFIMLVSLSEIKEEDKYQALVESMRKQFGHSGSTASLIPGDLRPRNSALERLATMGRARKQDVMQGGDKVQAPVGDFPRVMIVRPGTRTAVGCVIFFDDTHVELSAQNKEALRQQVEVMAGKPQKIEVRGHTSRRPAEPNAGIQDNWDLAYARSRNTMKHLVDVLGIDRERIRISVAAENEPAHIGTDASKLPLNPRVEIYMLDEVVGDLVGTNEEKQERYRDDRK